jgi:hypothetical protein
VGPPEEDLDLLRHLSYSLITPSVKAVKENKGNISELNNNINMNESIVPSDLKKLKARKVKRDDNENEFLETETCKRSVICDDDEESDEKKKKRNLKRKRINEPKRESIDFGSCASLPYKSQKVSSSKTPIESGLSKSKVIAKHLTKSIAKVPNSLPVAFVSISKAYSELIEGDQFSDVNNTVVTYVPDVFKCPDGYMSSQIYKVTKIPGWSIPIAILCALVFTIIINSFGLC